MKVQGTIEITAPPEKIWPYLVEPEKVLLWWHTYKEYYYAGEQRSGVGTRYSLEEHPGGPKIKIIFEVKHWDENKTLVLQMISGTGVHAYKQVYTIEKTSQGSRLDFKETVDLGMGLLGKLIGFLGESMSAGAVKKSLLKLKALVER